MAVTTDYLKLSVSERIQLVEDIWDSIAADSVDDFPLTEKQKRELNRRLEAHRADPTSAIPWEQVRARLFQQTP